ncbi:MAG: SAM-dependent methyltransferase [Acidiferrobacter sp.]|nr:SAM-dependent methyltransferase [Acidiferrobacter sp.]MBR42463.1 SAM-dependent methyltransferase [Acidiferrobacter sp.]
MRQADQADRHILYERAVQCVESEIDMVDETFLKLRGRQARTLREDFCGTANTSCEWVRRRADNLAWGVDLDEEVLAWGEKHNLGRLAEDATGRIQLLHADVLNVDTPAMDVVLAMNFSYWIFHTRQALRDYFSRIRECLVDDGMLFLDFYGGYETMREMEEETDHDDFIYVWDQNRYNPITGDINCQIHFKFPDGSQIKQAFNYDWRLWTLPEVRELLDEAGFSRVLVHWEGTDEKTQEGDGVFTATEIGEADAAFICYLSAEK